MELPPQLKHTSQRALHPAHRASGLSPASVTDSALADLGTPTGAAWYYPAPPSGSYSPALLESALETTLSLYPHLAGALSLVPPTPEESDFDFPPHTRAFGRVWVRWGPSEPGALVARATWDGPLTDVLPASGKSAAMASAVMPNVFAMVRLRASALGPACPGPATVAQITTFSCGGVAISIAVQHALIDAHALAYVVRDWAAAHKALLNTGTPNGVSHGVSNGAANGVHANGEGSSATNGATATAVNGASNGASNGSNGTPASNGTRATRPYNSLALDAFARAAPPNPKLEALSRTVPQLRLDFWSCDPANPADTAPGWFTRSRVPAPEIDGADAVAGRPRGPRAPFETWDADAPVGDAVLDLSAADVARLAACVEGAEANGGSANGHGSGNAKPSALDCVLAGVWRAIVRARGVAGPVNMHGCVGLRTRLGLPDDFQGAPMINVSAGLDAGALLGEGGEGAGARAVRSGINSVTAESAAAVLHHMANVLDPAREWNVFVGERNILSTSWLGIGGYAADFGAGAPARVHGFMPPVDGVVMLLEPPSAAGCESGVNGTTGVDGTNGVNGANGHHQNDENGTHTHNGKHAEHGARAGVSLRFLIREDVLAKVLADPELVGV